MGQVDGARRNVDVTRTLDKFLEHAERLVHITKPVLREQFLPLRLGGVEVARKLRFRFRDFGFKEAVIDTTHVICVRSAGSLKLLARVEARQLGQAFLRGTVGRNAVRLQVVLHLETVFHVAQEAVRLAQQPRLFVGEQFVLRQFVETRQGLRGL